MSGQAGDVAHGDETRARGRLGVDEPRQEAGGLRRLDEPARLEHAGVIRAPMRTRCARRHCRPRAVPFPTPRGRRSRAAAPRQSGKRAAPCPDCPAGRDKGGAAAGHERGDEHAALERSHDAAPVAEQLPHPLDPRRGRRHVDARADMRVGQARRHRSRSANVGTSSVARPCSRAAPASNDTSAPVSADADCVV